jgi:hypothetical protein
MNVLFPGTGVLLRSPGWLPTLTAVLGMAGWTLLVIALVTPGSLLTIPLGWVGLSAYLFAALVAAALWLSTERSSSRDLQVLQPIFNEAAGHYLRNDLAAAERCARRLIALAAGEPGTWRLLGVILRAQGAVKRAQRAEQRANRLAAAQN